MAIKTFKCEICGEEVTKPQSYAYGAGRACRKHEAAQIVHNKNEEAKKADLEEHKNKPRGFFARTGETKPPADLLAHYGMKNPNEHCWCCHKDGVYEHILMERYLINMSKLELKSDEPISIFEVEGDTIGPNKKIQEAMLAEFGDKVSLRRIEVAHEYPDWKLKQVINQNRKDDKIQLVRMTGIIVLCKECATKYEFPWLYASDRGVSLEQMGLIGHLVKPVIDSVAAGEIANESITDIMRK